MKPMKTICILRNCRRLTLLLAGLFAGLAELAPGAPLGSAFNYQGRLIDAGSPATGNYDLRFSLYDDESSGGIVGAPLTNLNVTVSNGSFNTMLDFGSTIFNGTAYWFELAVRTNGSAAPFTALSPRQPVIPSPYAIYASSAGLAANVGTTSAQPLDLKANNNRGLRLDYYSKSLGAGGGIGSVSGSDDGINLAGGYWGNAIDSDVVGATIAGGGYFYTSPVAGGDATHPNLVKSDFGAVGGGSDNVIESEAPWSTISGGDHNRIQMGAHHSTIAGGKDNTIQTNSFDSTIAGGGDNLIQTNAPHATIAGGTNNTIQTYAADSSIGGGKLNTIESSASSATIGGGAGNAIKVNSQYATIGGGLHNTIQPSAFIGTIPGGLDNEVSSSYGFAAGRRAKAMHQGAFVWGDGTDEDISSTDANQFVVRANGGVQLNSAAGVKIDSPTNSVQINSAKGISLDAQDRPLITRGFDPFDSTAGDKAGLGRWGLFMEPFALKIGIPAMENRGFEIVKYAANGDGDRLLTVYQNGDVMVWGDLFYKGKCEQLDWRNTPGLGDYGGVPQSLQSPSQVTPNPGLSPQGLSNVLKDKDARIQALEKDVAELKKLVNALIQKPNGGEQ